MEILVTFGSSIILYSCSTYLVICKYNITTELTLSPIGSVLVHCVSRSVLSVIRFWYNSTQFSGISHIQIMSSLLYCVNAADLKKTQILVTFESCTLFHFLFITCLFISKCCVNAIGSGLEDTDFSDF